MARNDKLYFAGVQNRGDVSSRGPGCIEALVGDAKGPAYSALASVGTETRQSIYERIGEEGLRDVVRRSLPWYLRFKSNVEYGRKVYGQMLRGSYSISDLFGIHAVEYKNSRKFRWLRPRFKEAEKILMEEYGIKRYNPVLKPLPELEEQPIQR